jgi:acyl carrier protein
MKSPTVVFFNKFKEDFKMAFPDAEFKIENEETMNEVIEYIYNTTDYNIDNEFNIIELY